MTTSAHEASNDPSSTGVEVPLAPANAARGGSAMSILRDVEVELTLEIGRRRMRIAEILQLGVGHTLELAKSAGEPLDIFVNGRLLGRGEAVVVGDRYGVRITELVNATQEGTQ